MAVDKALEMVNEFIEFDIVNKLVKINISRVWSFIDHSSGKWAGQNILCEPFI